MEDVREIAAYICQRYKARFGRCIDEMKLHKLLYFCQREAIVQIGEPLFGATFKAWRYGPVMVCIRRLYRSGEIQSLSVSEELREKYKSIFDQVFDAYASKDSWSLSSLTHGEYSWRKAREGYGIDEQCDVDIDTDDIRQDAERIKVRRFLLKEFQSLK